MTPEVQDWLKSREKPTLLILDGDSTSRSWLGGNPVVPSGFQWPTFHGESIPFLGQIRMADLPVVQGLPVFPKAGILYFFFFIEGGVSSDGDLEKGFAVIHSDQESGLSEMTPPGVSLEPTAAKGWRKLLGLKPKRVERRFYDRKPIAFKPIVSYPDSVPDDLVDTDNEPEIEEFQSRQFEGGKGHHLFGYPRPVQSTADEMAEDVSKPPLEGDDGKWALLLQVNEDSTTGFEWIDCGTVFFWISERDLANARFDRVRAIIDFS